ncbi:PadR family transcriptional regulator [Roseibium marinum]|nr:PadR family transcriptional regulator [Roseibium marinum]
MLSRKESYAYEISSELAEAVGIGESTIYPLMRRMQKEGLVVSRLVESNSGPSRKYYMLTEAGRQRLEQQARDWRTFMTSVNRIVGDGR